MATPISTGFSIRTITAGITLESADDPVGQLGHELARSLGNLGRVVILRRDGEHAVDLADRATIERALRARTPDVVVNAANRPAGTARVRLARA